MKKMTKAIAAAIVIAGFATNVNAQSTDFASATATLVAPISITKQVDMNFGQLAASGTAGTVVLDYASAVTRTGGVKLLSSTAVRTAEFLVEGEGTQGFSITYPASVILTGSVSGTLTVDGITCDAANASVLIAGAKTLKVKATLQVPANAVAGVYTNNTGVVATGLFVTVNYN